MLGRRDSICGPPPMDSGYETGERFDIAEPVRIKSTLDVRVVGFEVRKIPDFTEILNGNWGRFEGEFGREVKPRYRVRPVYDRRTPE